MITLVKPEQRTRNWTQIIAQVAFDLMALYLLHQIHIYIWRAMTGH